MLVPGGAFLVTWVSCALARGTAMVSLPMSALVLTSVVFGASQQDDVGDVGLAELHRLGAVREHRHGREQQIDAAGGQRGNAVGDFKRHEFDGNAEILAVEFADIGVEAFLLAAGIDEAPGRVVALNADHDLALAS